MVNPIIFVFIIVNILNLSRTRH